MLLVMEWNVNHGQEVHYSFIEHMAQKRDRKVHYFASAITKQSVSKLSAFKKDHYEKTGHLLGTDSYIYNVEFTTYSHNTLLVRCGLYII